MGKFINPFSDWGFKLIFGQDIHKDLLINFLNDLLKGEHVIKDITFLNNEQLPKSIEDRCFIYDVYCLTDKGSHIIVEMQNRCQTHFISRTIVYAANALVSQAEKGVEWDYHIESVYCISFMNFTTSELEQGKFRTDVVLADRETHRIVSDRLRFIYLQLPLFQKEKEECKNNFERWIFVLKNMETLDRIPFLAKNAVFQKLAQITNIAALLPEERRQYDASIKVFRDNIAMYKGAIEEGKAKGKIEEKRDIARRMKEMKLSVEQIQQITKLSPEEIAQL